MCVCASQTHFRAEATTVFTLAPQPQKQSSNNVRQICSMFAKYSVTHTRANIWPCIIHRQPALGAGALITILFGSSFLSPRYELTRIRFGYRNLIQPLRCSHLTPYRIYHRMAGLFVVIYSLYMGNHSMREPTRQRRPRHQAAREANHWARTTTPERPKPKVWTGIQTQ